MPLSRTLAKLYGIKSFVDCEPVYERSRNQGHIDKGDVLRHSLWKCQSAILIFLSPDFHTSEWCLIELYTALYRRHLHPNTAPEILLVFCNGMNLDDCDTLPAYAGLNLGETCQVYDTPYTHVEELVLGLHPLLHGLLRADSGSYLVKDSTFLKRWRRHCPLKPMDRRVDGRVIVGAAMCLALVVIVVVVLVVFVVPWNLTNGSVSSSQQQQQSVYLVPSNNNNSPFLWYPLGFPPCHGLQPGNPPWFPPVHRLLGIPENKPFWN